MFENAPDIKDIYVYKDHDLANVVDANLLKYKRFYESESHTNRRLKEFIGYYKSLNYDQDKAALIYSLYKMEKAAHGDLTPYRSTGDYYDIIWDLGINRIIADESQTKLWHNIYGDKSTTLFDPLIGFENFFLNYLYGKDAKIIPVRPLNIDFENEIAPINADREHNRKEKEADSFITKAKLFIIAFIVLFIYSIYSLIRDDYASRGGIALILWVISFIIVLAIAFFIWKIAKYIKKLFTEKLRK